MIRSHAFRSFSSLILLVMTASTSLVLLTSCAREEAPAEVVAAPSITPFHVVARGETLSIIAGKYNMNKMALIRINRLRPPYRIFIGQKLIIIPKDASMGAQGAQSAVKPVTSVADTGEVSVKELPVDEKNNPGAGLPVMGGGVLGSPTAGSAMNMPAEGMVLNNSANNSTGVLGATSMNAPGAPVGAEPVASDAPEGDGPNPMMETSQQSVPIASSGGGMQWPVQGQVIKSFGVDEKGQRNDGINIAATSGTAVGAADSGTVAHVGNQARGFGNLVLVKHPGGKISIYGHLQQTAVKVGDQVSAGQKIGTVGTSGGVSQPQLHFELRQGKTPLNPTEYLK